MRVFSVFSGVGGLDLGLERAGHDIVALCEVDPVCQSILTRHWPNVPLYTDIKEVDGDLSFMGTVDLVAGGSPCQDLSVAGRRKGLAGERSGLFWHQCRVAARVAARWVLWENVLGVLSSNGGEDFATVLWGLTGLRPAVPANGWRSCGVCAGPDRTAVWRVLDARWFGVAQRRRRVFVVAGPRDDRGLEVLLERESVPRHSRPERPPGTETAEGLGGSTTFRDQVSALTAIEGAARPDNVHAEAGWLVEVAGPINARQGKGPNTTLDDGAIVPITFAWQNGGGYGDANDGLAITEDASSPLSTSQTPAVAFSKVRHAKDPEDAETWNDTGVSPSLSGFEGHSDVRATVTVSHSRGVRRLTPRECERLMGWPDDWTRWGSDHAEMSDSQRYRLIGNGVVAPVSEWIGRRFP